MLRTIYREWLWTQEQIPDSLYYRLQCLKMWWAERPRLIKCDSCGRHMWWHGVRETSVFCGPECACRGKDAPEVKR